MLDSQAPIHHNQQTGVARTLGSGLMDEAGLHPHNLGFDLDCLVYDLRDELGATEDIDDLHRTRNCEQVGVGLHELVEGFVNLGR